MNWLQDRFKEKSTYAGIATIGLTLFKDVIPVPFADTIIELVAGGILLLINENKKR